MHPNTHISTKRSQGLLCWRLKNEPRNEAKNPKNEPKAERSETKPWAEAGGLKSQSIPVNPSQAQSRHTSVKTPEKLMNKPLPFRPGSSVQAARSGTSCRSKPTKSGLILRNPAIKPERRRSTLKSKYPFWNQRTHFYPEAHANNAGTNPNLCRSAPFCGVFPPFAFFATFAVKQSRF